MALILYTFLAGVVGTGVGGTGVGFTSVGLGLGVGGTGVGVGLGAQLATMPSTRASTNRLLKKRFIILPPFGFFALMHYILVNLTGLIFDWVLTIALPYHLLSN
jgi:hypothetical protein